MRVQRQDPPWRAVRAFRNEASESLVHLHNVSGGILGGDNLNLQIAVGSYARAQVTSVGATRIYRQKEQQTCATQKTTFHVAEGALLEYLPDALIPYGGHGLLAHRVLSRLRSWSDRVGDSVSGSTAYGESFSFDEFTSSTTISNPNRLLALENYSLCPKRHNMRAPNRFGRFEHCATMWVCLVDQDAARWTSLEHKLSQLATEISHESVFWGASSLVENGVVIRGLHVKRYLITKGLGKILADRETACVESPGRYAAKGPLACI